MRNFFVRSPYKILGSNFWRMHWIIGLVHFSGVANKSHHCLRFPCGSPHLVPALVSQTRVLVIVSHTSLVSHTNITLVCDTNAGTRWRFPHGKRKQG